MKGLVSTVTGATGFIGRHLLERLLVLGVDIEAVVLDSQQIPQTWRNRIEIRQEDIAVGVKKFNQGTDVVFHLASELKEKNRFWRTNVEGTRNVLAACANSNIKRFVYLSSVGVMGIEKQGVFDEAVGCSPRNEYERTKWEAEKLVLEAHKKYGLEVAILRPSIVYGPGKPPQRDSFLSLIRSIRNGYFRYIGSEKTVYNIIYVGDVVKAMLHLALSHQAAEGNVCIINDPMQWGEFVISIQSLLDCRQEVATIPKSVAYALALGAEAAKRLGINVPFSLSRYKALSSRTIFSSERIKKYFGFKLPYGNEVGLKKTLEFYQANNLL